MRIVSQLSGNRCAFPRCGRTLIEPATDTDREVQLAEVGHIVAIRGSGPRGGSELSDTERNDPSNLIILCSEHHAIVDGQPNHYTVPRLFAMKAAHERAVQRRMGTYSAAPLEANTYVQDDLVSTLLPVTRVPEYLYSGSALGTTITRDQFLEGLRAIGDTSIHAYLQRNGLLWSLTNLANEHTPFSGLVEISSVQRHDLSAQLGHDDGKRLVVDLFNQSFRRYCSMKGIAFDKDHHRLYFRSQVIGTAREITHKSASGRRTTKKVVWQPVTRITKTPKSFWYHRALEFRFHSFGDYWVLSLRPTFHVTKDGSIPLESHRVGSKVTRKMHSLFNYQLLEELHFWKDYLCGSKPRLIITCGSQSLVIEAKFIQASISWPGLPEEFKKTYQNQSAQEDLFSLAELNEALL